MGGAPEALVIVSGFFCVAAFAASLWALVKRQRWRQEWCRCGVCRSYTMKDWASEFYNLCDWYTHLLRRSPSHTIHLHVLHNTVTANPENVRHMLTDRFENYPKGRPFSSILGDFLGRGIFNVDGPHWILQRKLALMELGSVSMRSYAQRIVAGEVKQRLLPFLASVSGAGAPVIDLQDIFRRFSFDCICKISFGMDPSCLELSLPISEFAAAFDKASVLSAGRAAATSPAAWRLKRLLNLGSEKELRRCITLIDILAGEVIRQRRKLGFLSGEDLLSRFMGSVDDDRYLRDIVVSFLLAGRDTVSSALTGFFLLLSRNPAAERVIVEETRRAANGEDVSGDDQLNNMHYVHAALHESMRLYPPVHFDSKFAVADDILPDGTFVKKGTRVTYHAYAMGRMEDAWGPDCLEFKPERWLRQDGSFSPAKPYKYPVFHAGVRSCIGKEIALMEMKCVVAAVVLRFRLVPLHSHRPPKFSLGLTASFAGGLPVRVLHRHDKPL